jgi:hypothetical protein
MPKKKRKKVRNDLVKLLNDGLVKNKILNIEKKGVLSPLFIFFVILSISEESRNIYKLLLDSLGSLRLHLNSNPSTLMNRSISLTKGRPFTLLKLLNLLELHDSPGVLELR